MNLQIAKYDKRQAHRLAFYVFKDFLSDVSII